MSNYNIDGSISGRDNDAAWQQQAVTISNKTITASTLDDSVIGGTTPAKGTFTALDATVGITTPAIGASDAQHHTIPAVTSDTVALLNATQTLTNKTLASPTVSGNAILSKTSGTGIQVDVNAPTFGWRDLTSDIIVRATGASDPVFNLYGATLMRQYQFSATVLQEVFMVFHVPHDWIAGTAIYLHAHWSNAATTPNTGAVMWGFDYSFAKGFNQEAFPAFTTITVTQSSPAIRYRHMVAETVAITIPTMEVDGLILVRAYRNAANAADTCTDAVFLHTMDIHYQSSNLATKNKAPNFYA